MEQFEPYNEPLKRKPVTPSFADRVLVEGPPHPPQQKVKVAPKPEVGPSNFEVVPDEDNPLSGWRALGLSSIHPSLWRGQGRYNPLVAYFGGRRKGRAWEDFIGLLPWLLSLIGYSTYILQPGVTESEVISAGLIAMMFLPELALLAACSCITVHIRRNLRVLPLQELLLTRLRPQEIAMGLAVRPIAIQNVGLALYVFASAAIMIARPLLAGAAPSVADVFVIVVMISCQYFLSSLLIEFAAGATLRANLFIRQAHFAWARSIYDTMMSAAPLLIILGLLIGCGWMWIPGALIVLGLLFLLVALGRAVVSWVQEYAWDPIYWSVRYVNEWWVFQGGSGKAGDVPERTVMTPWRPLAMRAGFASRISRP